MRLFTTFCLLWLMWLALGNADEPKIVCYYYSLAMINEDYERMPVSSINPNLCTHLIYASVGITEDGDVHVINPQLDLSDDKGRAGFERFNALLRLQDEKLKTLVSSGNWNGGSAKYSKVAGDSSLRSKYVKNVVDFVLRHKFDGFDINWQFPNMSGHSPDDVQNFVLLLKELRQSFDEHELILSIAVEGSEKYAEMYYDIPQISKYVHFVLLSTECHKPSDPITGHSAPLYSAAREVLSSDRSLNINASVHYWLKQGMPAEKLILGTQFHGLSYILENAVENVPGSPASGPAEYRLGLGSVGYNEICRLTREDDWTIVWDKEQHVPYSYSGNRWISYDNVRSLAEKGRYAKAMGLGGVMVWSIDLDDHQGECGEQYPLLNALNCGLLGTDCSSKSTDPDDDRSPKVVCYYYGLAIDSPGYIKMEPSDADPSLCTHMIYASVGISEDGDVRVLNPNIELPDNGGKAGFQKLNALRKKNERLRTLISTGNWGQGSAKYSKVVADTSLRSKYVKNVVDFVLRHEFDGFDINWQFPNINGDSPDDLENFVLLLKELRAIFDERKLILSITVEGSEKDAKKYYNIPKLSKYPHFILLATECHKSSDPFTGHSAPLYPAEREKSSLDRSLNIDASVLYWTTHGAPKEKLILGTLFHGISYILKNSTEHVPGSPVDRSSEYRFGLGFLGYNEICRLIQKDDWTTVWDEEQRVPYSYSGDRWISYDNVRSLTEKAGYAELIGLGGIMVWSIDLDDHHGVCGEQYPLLKALNCRLRNIGCSEVPTPEVEAPKFEVLEVPEPLTTAKIADWMTFDLVPPSTGDTLSPISEPDVTDYSREDAKITCAKYNRKYVRHPQNCAKFWICRKIDENKFNAEPFICGHGLYFDPFRIICESESLVECN